MHSFSPKFSPAECEHYGYTAGNPWCCSKRVGDQGRRIPLQLSINLQFTQLRVASWDQGRPWLPFLLKVQQYLYEMPYSKYTEAFTNVSYPPAWTNVGCGSILKDWIWALFLGLPVASLYKLLVIKCFFKCDSVWLRRAMAKLPPAPEESPILLLTCFKIFYLLIFLLLFWGDFFFFECLTVLLQAVPSTVEMKRHPSPAPWEPTIELCLK